MKTITETILSDDSARIFTGTEVEAANRFYYDLR